MISLVSFLTIAVVIFIGLILWANNKRRTFSENQQKAFKKHWEEILIEKVKNPKNAILEADKLLDEAFKIKGYSGSLGEKLKCAEKCFSKIDEIWNAHKLRNRIAHELSIEITPYQTDRALRDFKRALEELGVEL